MTFTYPAKSILCVMNSVSVRVKEAELYFKIDMYNELRLTQELVLQTCGRLGRTVAN